MLIFGTISKINMSIYRMQREEICVILKNSMIRKDTDHE